MTKILATAAVISAGGIWSVQAQPFSGSSSGTFINPVPGVDNPTPAYTGIGTSSITTGSGTDPNVFTFTGASFGSVPAETPFSVGSLYYYNGTQPTGSQIDGVTLDIALAFTTPNGLNESFAFPLGITTTVNTSDPAASADYVTLPAASSTTFTVGPDIYTLKLNFDTFVGDGFLVGSTFHVYEQGAATANIEGIITTNLQGVPDGASTMLLLGGAGGLLCWLRRK